MTAQIRILSDRQSGASYAEGSEVSCVILTFVYLKELEEGQRGC